ncbi:Zinc-finger homeodomain protein [Quillaja saponaria]|uniref:Zinc-finger homeodomain protein n=1 Tax=Quillaja saponaria TaxID=32244 RepID=A0AAD7P6Q1_QUISA|nr:Zinc-finger homeodomain protein [Quillaja saponaria]
MELRGQEERIGMPNTLGHNQPNGDSSSKLQSSSILGQASDIQPPQNRTVFHNLDHHHLYDPHQSNPPQQSNGPRKDPDPTITAPVATTIVTSIPKANSKSPSPKPRTTATSTTTTIVPTIRYRECMKNHAASMGSHVVDGCGEFMPSGEEINPEALKCAACECHRNFHRKEIEGEPQQQYVSNTHYTYNPNKNNTQREIRIPSSHTQFPPSAPPYLHQKHHKYFTTPSAGLNIPPMMMAFGSGGGLAESSSEDLNMFQSNVGRQTSSVRPPLSKKRFRTKFTQAQKDKMMEFADKLEWKIQKQDEKEVQEFCSQLGVKRKVFKVWMHNNKQAMKKKHM